jgi:hypothetical protein
VEEGRGQRKIAELNDLESGTTHSVGVNLLDDITGNGENANRCDEE